MVRSLGFLLAFFIWVDISQAQQTIFNVPSADVLNSKTFYIENDWYVRPWETASGRYGTTYVRAVAGVGQHVELGLNLGAFDLVNSNNPFVDLAAKWRPWVTEIGDGEKAGALGFYLGNHIGVGMEGSDAGQVRDFVYGALLFKIPTMETRICGGPYFATSRVFSAESRPGALLTFEQPIQFLPGLVFAADWFTGDGAYLTPGFIYSQSPFTLYLGYGLANTGRKDDQVTAEIGVTF